MCVCVGMCVGGWVGVSHLENIVVINEQLSGHSEGQEDNCRRDMTNTQRAVEI